MMNAIKKQISLAIALCGLLAHLGAMDRPPVSPYAVASMNPQNSFLQDKRELFIINKSGISGLTFSVSMTMRTGQSFTQVSRQPFKHSVATYTSISNPHLPIERAQSARNLEKGDYGKPIPKDQWTATLRRGTTPNEPTQHQYQNSNNNNHASADESLEYAAIAVFPQQLPYQITIHHSNKDIFTYTLDQPKYDALFTREFKRVISLNPIVSYQLQVYPQPAQEAFLIRRCEESEGK